MIKTGIVLKNKYLIKQIPKTKGKGFSNLRDGDVIEISLELTHGRDGSHQSLYAYYPKINGVECAGIPFIQSLIDKGMILEEVNSL